MCNAKNSNKFLVVEHFTPKTAQVNFGPHSPHSSCSIDLVLVAGY